MSLHTSKTCSTRNFAGGSQGGPPHLSIFCVLIPKSPPPHYVTTQLPEHISSVAFWHESICECAGVSVHVYVCTCLCISSLLLSLSSPSLILMSLLPSWFIHLQTFLDFPNTGDLRTVLKYTVSSQDSGPLSKGSTFMGGASCEAILLAVKEYFHPAHEVT